jgi:hypothetical protein
MESKGMDAIEKFKQLVGETLDEEVVRGRLRQLNLPCKHLWAGGGQEYGIYTVMGGVEIRAFVELSKGTKSWNISKAG